MIIPRSLRPSTDTEEIATQMFAAILAGSIALAKVLMKIFIVLKNNAVNVKIGQNLN